MAYDKLRITATCRGSLRDPFEASSGEAKYMIAAEITPKTTIKTNPLRNNFRPTPYSFNALYFATCLATAPGMPAVEIKIKIL